MGTRPRSRATAPAGAGEPTKTARATTAATVARITNREHSGHIGTTATLELVGYRRRRQIVARELAPPRRLGAGSTFAARQAEPFSYGLDLELELALARTGRRAVPTLIAGEPWFVVPA